MNESNYKDIRPTVSLQLPSSYSEEPKKSYRKSDVNLKLNEWSTLTSKGPHNITDACGEYFNKHECSIVDPTDDYPSYASLDALLARDPASLTDSELKHIEAKLFRSDSQEIKKDDSSIGLESNIKFFKSTVQELFDNFHNCMQDYEGYKARYQEIVDKSKVNSLHPMEDLVKEMIQHIIVSEHSKSSKHSHRAKMTKSEINGLKQNVSISDVTTSGNDISSDNGCVVQNAALDDNNCKNAALDDNNCKNAALDDNNCKLKKSVFQSVSLPKTSARRTNKMNERLLLSDINIRGHSSVVESSVASAEDLKKLAAKRIEMDNLDMDQIDSEGSNISIPIKVSSAKKDLRLDEEKSREKDETKSFLSKICSFICRRFRKTPMYS